MSGGGGGIGENWWPFASEREREREGIGRNMMDGWVWVELNAWWKIRNE